MENYEKIKSIGKGNYGKAVLCKNRKDNLLYVLKSIDISEMSEDQINSALFEVELLKSFKHPYIIKFINYFFYLKYLVIVMEYADCGDLQKLIKTQKKIGKPIKEEILMNWFVQLCFAVKYLHDRKILHRDLKLSNIFISLNSEIKLGDFGISKILESTQAYAKSIVGTPYYLSPEICNKKEYNYKSDIWSMGCLLYELMTCGHAFEAKNINELCDKIQHKNYKEFSKDLEYSNELFKLVDALLQKDPDDRPSIDEILEMNVILRYIKINLIKQITSKQETDEMINDKSSCSEISKLSKKTIVGTKNKELIFKYDEIQVTSNDKIQNEKRKQKENIDKLIKYLKLKLGEDVFTSIYNKIKNDNYPNKNLKVYRILSNLIKLEKEIE